MDKPEDFPPPDSPGWVNLPAAKVDSGAALILALMPVIKAVLNEVPEELRVTWWADFVAGTVGMARASIGQELLLLLLRDLVELTKRDVPSVQ